MAIKMRRIVGLICVFALAASTSVLAKDKTGGGVSAETQSVTADLQAKVLADAERLCALIVEDDGEIISVLEQGGWTHEIDRNIGNVPYYKELSANLTYPGVGEADLWGFGESYPGHVLGYCSFTISNPEFRFSIDALDGRDQLVGEMETREDQVYGAWRDVSARPSIFIHAYHNSDTFSYQITRINKRD